MLHPNMIQQSARYVPEPKVPQLIKVRGTAFIEMEATEAAKAQDTGSNRDHCVFQT